MNRRWICLFTLVSLLSFAGCGNNSARQMSQSTKAVEWPAQKALMDSKLLQPIGMGIQMRRIEEARKAATSAELEQALAAFEKEAIPSGAASPARESAKKEVVEAYKSLIEKAKSNAPLKELQDAFAAVTAANNKLVDPALK
jgi:hypothetical protein